MYNKYTFNEVKQIFAKHNLQLLELGYINVKQRMLCRDFDGYYRVPKLENLISRHSKGKKFHKNNPYSIYNINHYLVLNNIPFKCISTKYINASENLDFICNRCNEKISTPWKNVNKNDNPSRYRIKCPNCDGRIESLHALILKQIFLHEYPDTIVEEQSCINPKTGKIMCTDIVNHRLKIAIEIQSFRHDYPENREKDLYKKNFWTNKGYNFYTPDIRDYGILEMCQLFFCIDKIPDYIDYEYSNKLNIKKAQKLLNTGMSVKETAEQMNVDKHRIYDALGKQKLHYPANYQRRDWTPVILFDLEWNYIGEFSSIHNASRYTGIKANTITAGLWNGKHTIKGYNWMYKKDYKFT